MDTDTRAQLHIHGYLIVTRGRRCYFFVKCHLYHHSFLFAFNSITYFLCYKKKDLNKGRKEACFFMSFPKRLFLSLSLSNYRVLAAGFWNQHSTVQSTHHVCYCHKYGYFHVTIQISLTNFPRRKVQTIH